MGFLHLQKTPYIPTRDEYNILLASHVCALLIVWKVHNNLIRALILGYICLEIMVSSGKASYAWRVCNSIVVVWLSLYITYRICTHKPRDKRWVGVCVVFLGWIIVEVLCSNSFGYITNYVDTTRPVLYEVIVHLSIWIGLYLCLVLVPDLLDA